MIKNETILVSICHVNSELGIKQNIEEIAKVLKNYPKLFFHVDATQAIGKININLDNIDLCSFSSHKIYGPKGIGCLVVKDRVRLTPLLHGGKSDSLYRSGTPALPLIVSLSKALRIALTNIDEKYNYIKNLNEILNSNFKDNKYITINSNQCSIPHILNISLNNIKPETFIHALEKENVYISTKSACSSVNEPSKGLIALNKNQKEINSSIRISLSHLTTKEDIYKFVEIFNKNFEHLNNLRS